MNLSDAAYATVHDYPGGSMSLGPRVGIVPAVLRNKCCAAAVCGGVCTADRQVMIGMVLLALALVAFIWAAVGWPCRANMVAVGLALMVLARLVAALVTLHA